MSRLRNGAAVGKRKAIDLSGLSLTCLQLDGEGMGEKKKKRGPGGASMTLPDSIERNWRCSGEFSLFQVAALYFKMIQLRPFVHLNSDNCFFFPLFFQRHKELSLVC